MKAFNKKHIFFSIIAAGLLASGSVWAGVWTEPSATPPGSNAERPLHVGSDPQEKAGTLILSNTTNGYGALKLRDSNASKYITLRNATSMTGDYSLVLPSTTPSGSGYILIGTPSGSDVALSWLNPASIAGSLPAGTAGQTLRHNGTTWVASNNIYNNDGNVGIGVANPANFKLQILGNVGPNSNATYDLGSASYRWSNVYANALNIGGSFTVDSAGVVQSGSVPWTRLTTFPTACAAGQYVTGIGGALTCSAPMPVGGLGQTMYHNGTNWVSSINIYNAGGNVGIGTVSAPADFKLQVLGSVGPDTASLYDLGSAAKRWRTVYADNIDINTSLKLNLATGSVAFINSSKYLAEDNNNFFWDASNRRLGLGTKTPDQALQVVGDIHSTMAGSHTGGILRLGDKVWIHAQNGWLNNMENVSTRPQDWQSWKHFMTDSDSSLLEGISPDSLDPNEEKYQTNFFAGDGAGLNSDETMRSMYAGFQNTNYANVGIGFKSLVSYIYNTKWNVAIGARTMQMATLADYNVALGGGSLSAGYMYTNNVSIGYDAMHMSGSFDASNAEASQNVAIGSRSLSQVQYNANVAVGYEALREGVFMRYNTAVGYQAGMTIGSNLSNTDTYNTLIGYQAGKLATSTNESIFIGFRAGQESQNSDRNIYIGSYAGRNNTGDDNLILGTLDLTGATNSNHYFGLDNGTRRNGLSPITDFARQPLLTGRFYDANNVGNLPFLRVNASLFVTNRGNSSVTPSASASPGSIWSSGYNSEDSNVYYKGLTLATAANGKCLSVSTTNMMKFFYVDGLLVCVSPSMINASCPAYDLTTCCTAQGGCNP